MEIKNIATALSKAQIELKNPEKSKPGYGYKYAELPVIIDAVKPVLEKHGLCVTQLATDDGNGRVGVETILMHTSGEFLTSKLTLPIPDMKGATSTQAAGAAITYARRYALSAILNIASDEDTDATNQNGSSKAPVKTQPKSTPKASESQVKAIQTLCTKTNTDPETIKEHYKINSMNDLNAAQASSVIQRLAARGEVH